MQILDLEQGSGEWLEARLNNCCASEAPVVMGVSKFMTRNQLLDAKKGWEKSPDSEFKKRLFQKGHDHEETARKILEIETLDDYPPIVGRVDVEGMTFLASFDGLENGVAGGMSWEHKDWNKTLAENVRNGVIEALHYWQLEHQMIVNGTDVCRFRCSDGTADNIEEMLYKSVPERRVQLVAGWKQFLNDLESHEIEAKAEIIEAKKAGLPVITFSVTGSEIETNIGQCLADIKDLAAEEMARIPESDQDFANKEQLKSDVKKARAELKKVIDKVRGEFVSYAEFESIAKEVDSVLQKLQSQSESQVKQAKQEKKNAIASKAEIELQCHIEQAELKMGKLSLRKIISIAPDWPGAMKSKRTLESLQAAIDSELARCKVEINQAMDVIIPNIEHLNNHEEFKFLFNDLPSIVNQPVESFQAVVKARIADFKAEQEKSAKLRRLLIDKAEQEKSEELPVETANLNSPEALTPKAKEFPGKESIIHLIASSYGITEEHALEWLKKAVEQ